MKLNIENETEFYTSDLRKIFRKCMEQEGVHKCSVTVKPCSGKTVPVHGEAYLNSTRVWMYLPEGTPQKVDLVAQVFIHELHHNLGLKHREMINVHFIDVSAVAGMNIRRRKQKEKKPEKSLQEKRYEKALKMKKKYEKQIKQKQKLLKKWSKKVKYYEGVFNG